MDVQEFFWEQLKALVIASMAQVSVLKPGGTGMNTSQLARELGISKIIKPVTASNGFVNAVIEAIHADDEGQEARIETTKPRGKTWRLTKHGLSQLKKSQAVAATNQGPTGIQSESQSEPQGATGSQGVSCPINAPAGDEGNDGQKLTNESTDTSTDSAVEPPSSDAEQYDAVPPVVEAPASYPVPDGAEEVVVPHI